METLRNVPGRGCRRRNSERDDTGMAMMLATVRVMQRSHFSHRKIDNGVVVVCYTGHGQSESGNILGNMGLPRTQTQKYPNLHFQMSLFDPIQFGNCALYRRLGSHV